MLEASTRNSSYSAVFLPISNVTDTEPVSNAAYTLSIPVQANWRTAVGESYLEAEKKGEVENWLRIVKVVIQEGAPAWVLERVRAMSPRSLGKLVCGDNKDQLCISNLSVPEGFREQ